MNSSRPRSYIEPRKGRHGLREAVLAWAGRHAPALDRLDRCSGDDRCPACDLGEPCPLDTWREPLAPLAIGDIDKRARSFLKPNGSQAGTGAYTTWLKRGLDHSVADAALARRSRRWCRGRAVPARRRPAVSSVRFASPVSAG